MTTQEVYNRILEAGKLQEALTKIGGHKIYHREGNAWVHTMLVVDQAKRSFGDNPFFNLVALLHDLGKAYTSIENGPDDWSYPNHSVAGADQLINWVNSNDLPEWPALKWFILNHIKPLFWRGKSMEEINKVLKSVPVGFENLCTISNLAKLALCDLGGSQPVEPQTELQEFLESLV